MSNDILLKYESYPQFNDNTKIQFAFIRYYYTEFENKEFNNKNALMHVIKAPKFNIKVYNGIQTMLNLTLI